MSESARAAASGAESTGSGPARPAPKPKAKAKAGRGLFERIAIFFRQVVAELKKVVWPTRTELGRYISVVLVFVVVVMAFVALVDVGVGSVMRFVFGGR
ncbi:MAG TPA: preprotein translocase subunit SecE [Actinotalea sp.]